ncbi:PorT family protein [Parabacteroides sp. OttesenSCG-928-K15]|nr:PorT family protein [Parabacteroides sp. OttesenSCG-928-K15]
MRKEVFILCILLLVVASASGQTERVKNQPYADMKLYHLGFHIGLHSQDMILTHSGVTENGETWFAEIPSYNPGFSVGVIGDMYLSPYFNLRVIPTLHFGDKTFLFREKTTGEEVQTNVRANYLTLPVNIKYSALRLNNYRPYLIGGVYGQMDIGRKKGEELLMKGFGFGVEFGVGCDIYLPYFKLCPELKFCFGLGNVLDKNRTDLTDPEMMKYTNALSRASTRMVVLTFNFE